MLLIFATRYDEVTVRTFTVAQFLQTEADSLGLQIEVLLETEATTDGLNAIISQPIDVFAFYSHGDESGRILAQDRMPVWTDENCPDFKHGAVFAHACRAMLALEQQFERLNARMAVGYRIDLKLPPDGSDEFWTFYQRLHILIPVRLLNDISSDSLRVEFYDLATDYFTQIHQRGGGLIELIALQQSRDELTILEKPR